MHVRGGDDRSWLVELSDVSLERDWVDSCCRSFYTRGCGRVRGAPGVDARELESCYRIFLEDRCTSGSF